MRTNIDIDDALMKRAMMLSGIPTKRELVERALSEFVERHSRKDLSELHGQIFFAQGYDYKAMREGKEHDPG